MPATLLFCSLEIHKKISMKYLLSLFSLLLFSTFSLAQNKDSIMVKKMVDEVMTNATAYSNLRVLCKEVGPRLSGSEGYAKAVEKAREMMLKAGADRVYLQECMVPHWVRGEKEKGKIILADGKEFNLNLVALGNSVGSDAAGVSGKIIEVGSLAEIGQRAAEVKGNIVFINIKMNPTYINTFKAYSESGIGRRQGAAQASKYGAKGVLVRALSINLTDNPNTGGTTYNDSFPKIPAVAISTNDAERLSKEIKKNNVKSGWFFSGAKMLPEVKAYNVIGEIRGSEFPDEIITVGGHLDSWDLAEGANDDGSGVVQSIEVIRAFTNLGIRPKRTVRAVAFANEENGGRGGRAYFDEAKKKNEKHVFALESDAGGFTPRGFGFTASDEQMNKIMQWKPLFFPYGIYDFQRGGGGADINLLKNIGSVLCGLVPDSQRYFDIHHTSADVFENVSERELNLGAANMAAMIYLVSEYGM